MYFLISFASGNEANGLARNAVLEMTKKQQQWDIMSIKFLFHIFFSRIQKTGSQGAQRFPTYIWHYKFIAPTDAARMQQSQEKSRNNKDLITILLM